MYRNLQDEKNPGRESSNIQKVQSQRQYKEFMTFSLSVFFLKLLFEYLIFIMGLGGFFPFFFKNLFTGK